MGSLVISDPKTGRAYHIQDSLERFIGRSLGDEIPGEIIGLEGYKLKIVGGSDRDGFPMRWDLPGGMRKRLLIASKDGVRRRKRFVGRMVTPQIVQLNLVVIQHGSQPLDELIQKLGERKHQRK